MSFTPLHFRSALFLGLMLLQYLDFPTFLIANVIVDIKPFAVMLLNLNCPLHGFYISFLGGTSFATALTAFMAGVRMRFNRILLALIEQETTTRKILSASLLGIYIHII